jgi:hypothetical protein
MIAESSAQILSQSKDFCVRQVKGHQIFGDNLRLRELVVALRGLKIAQDRIVQPGDPIDVLNRWRLHVQKSVNFRCRPECSAILVV